VRMYERPREESEYVYPNALAKLLAKAESLEPLPLPPPDRVPMPPVKLVSQRLDGDELISGVDAGHRGKELTGYFLGAVTSLAYTSKPRILQDRDPICRADIFRFQSVKGRAWLSLMDALFTFSIAKKVAEDRDPDFLLIDGPLLLHPDVLFHPKDVRGEIDVDRRCCYSDDLRACIETLFELMRACKDRDIKLAAFVKRPRGTLIDPVKRRRDAVLLARSMKLYGSRTSCLSPGDHPAWKFYVGMGFEEAREPYFIKVVYIKSSKVKPPFRLEIPRWVDDEAVCSAVLSTSDPISGVPAHILRAESLIRMGEGTLKSVFLRILSRSLVKDRDAEWDLVPVHGEEFEAVGR